MAGEGRRKSPEWTWVPPYLTGTQTEATPTGMFGRYTMPDGSEQVSFGGLNALRKFGQGLGLFPQDPDLPPGYARLPTAEEAINAAGLASAGPVGGAAGAIARGARPDPSTLSVFMTPSQFKRTSQAGRSGWGSLANLEAAQRELIRGGDPASIWTKYGWGDVQRAWGGKPHQEFNAPRGKPHASSMVTWTDQPPFSFRPEMVEEAMRTGRSQRPFSEATLGTEDIAAAFHHRNTKDPFVEITRADPVEQASNRGGLRAAAVPEPTAAGITSGYRFTVDPSDADAQLMKFAAHEYQHPSYFDMTGDSAMKSLLLYLKPSIPHTAVKDALGDRVAPLQALGKSTVDEMLTLPQGSRKSQMKQEFADIQEALKTLKGEIDSAPSLAGYLNSPWERQAREASVRYGKPRDWQIQNAPGSVDTYTPEALAPLKNPLAEYDLPWRVYDTER